MGKGKGEVEYWAAVVKPGTILFEIGGVSEELARATLARVAHKMPVPAGSSPGGRRSERIADDPSRQDSDRRRP